VEEDQDAAAPPRTEKPPMRFSLAGVQLKFSGIARTRGGMTIPVTGVGGDWIIKLPSTRFAGVSANEFAMMTMARMIGMDIPETRLVPLTDIEGLPSGIERIEEDAFAIRRFDRLAEGRVHIEDFAQVFGVYPEEKYGRASYISIAKVLWIETGEAGIAEFIRRLVFNTLIGNADMHLKNWSLLYPDGRRAALSPGYDFVATTAYIPDDNAALRFGRSKRMADLSLDELSYLAAKAGLPQGLVIDTAKTTVAAVRDVWARERANLPIAKAVSAEIERLLAIVPIAAEA
jgi:serine/threonine-protein kinase HipA